MLARLLLLLALASLPGCTSLYISAVTKAGESVAEERSIGNAIDDASIWAQIKHAYLQKNAQDLLAGVNVEVIEGRVHLTGSVETVLTRIDAVKLAWKPKGVKEVINEIQIVEEKNLKDIAIDKYIKTHLRAKMFFGENVKSLNYSTEVVNGTVYLMGIYQNEEELNKVIDFARRIKGVKKVINHARPKHSPERELK